MSDAALVGCIVYVRHEAAKKAVDQMRYICPLSISPGRQPGVIKIWRHPAPVLLKAAG